MSWSRTIALAGLLAALPAVQALPITYDYLLNTNALSGTAADLYFALAPGFLGTPPLLTASISDFQGAALTGPPFTLGTVSGTLPGVVELTNLDATNLYLHGLTLGSSIRFRVTFDGAMAPSEPSGSSFAFGLLDAGGSPLFTTDPAGDIARVNIDAAGNTSLEGLQPIPEPGTLLLTGFSAALLLLWRGSRPLKS